MKVRLLKKQMKKARPYWESQGYKFKRKAKIIRYSQRSLLGDYSTKWIDYCFVNMNGRITKLLPIPNGIQRRKRKSRRLVALSFFLIHPTFLVSSAYPPV